MSPSVPFKEVKGEPARLLTEYGAEVSDLYRALANNEDVLELWVTMAWGLRTRAKTPRALRELMILRSAHVQGAAYQWADHTVMALAAGVGEAQIQAISHWTASDVFDEVEAAVLALIDEMLVGHVSDDTLELLQEKFEPAQIVELIITGGFYCMVPRVLDALRLPVLDALRLPAADPDET